MSQALFYPWIDIRDEGWLKMLQELAAPSERGVEWLRVGDGFANFYMTLLANRLSEGAGARLLTSIPAADRLAVTARLEAQLEGLRKPRFP